MRDTLNKLRELGILNWGAPLRGSRHDGRFVLEQKTNAHALLSDIQWRGYKPSAPTSGTWRQ